ncbi:hypothetical protein G5S34_04535 [Herbaspirillum frisingense]|uniref:hypothetical protein n=1 Tax=Herbaspirillum frisingense TaxID=92645 RepID=UPI00160245DE|nr:hypothetical protein [Herbaspirillum frisingense]QNB06108.1 hypothetical protein G5S34_04535 [Herbaspirillum frisingense]
MKKTTLSSAEMAEIFSAGYRSGWNACDSQQQYRPEIELQNWLVARRGTTPNSLQIRGGTELWPKEVRAKIKRLANGAVAYQLAHDVLGKLGFIVLNPVSGPDSDVTFEVWLGDGDDGTQSERTAILLQLRDNVVASLQKERITGALRNFPQSQ